MALQRHLKILGIFCRLNYRDGKSATIMGDLPTVSDYVRKTCQPLHSCSNRWCACSTRSRTRRRKWAIPF